MKSDLAGCTGGDVCKKNWWVGFALVLCLGFPRRADAGIEVGPRQAVDPKPGWIATSLVPAGVASNGAGWLALSGYEWDPRSLWATRIAADGTVLDHPSIQIAAAEENIGDSSLSFDGSHYVASWVQNPAGDGPWTVHLQRIAADGTLFGENVTLGTEEQSSYLVALATASTSSSDLVVWCETSLSFSASTCTWVQVEGPDVVASDSIAFESNIAGLEVEASGDSWLIAASTSNAQTGSADAFLLRVGSDGLALDDAPLPLAASTATEGVDSLAPTESGWAVLWHAGYDLKSALVSHEGAIAINETPLTDESTILSSPSLERTPDGFVLIGQIPGGLATQHLAADLTPASDLLLVDGEGVEYFVEQPLGAWGGSSLLVVWSGDSYIDPGAFAKRFSSQGQVLDTDRIVVTSRPNDQSLPVAARGADSWLVAWEDNRAQDVHIYAQRLDDTGAPSSELAIPIATPEFGGTSPALAGSPSGWLVAWTQGNGDIVATRISPDGGILDDEPIDLGHRGRPTVAFDGTHWVIAWVEQLNAGAWVGTTKIVRLDTSGEIVDSAPIAVSDTNKARLGVLQVGINDTGYSVAWQPESGGLVVRRVNFDGVPDADSPGYILEPEVGVSLNAKLAGQDGIGWLFWHAPSGLTFEPLGTDLPAQVFTADPGYDLVATATQALAGWSENSKLKLGLARAGGALEIEAELDESVEQLVLAIGSEAKALLVTEVEEGAPLASHRLYARVLDLTSDDAGGAGGTAGEGDAGEPSVGGGGRSTGAGGEPDDNGGSSGDSEGGKPSSDGGAAHGGTASSGGSAGDDDRYVSCTCRAANPRSSAVPHLALILAFGLYARRRQRSASTKAC